MAAPEALPPWHISTITIFDGRYIDSNGCLSSQSCCFFFFFRFVMIVWKSNASFPTSGRHIRDLRIFHYIGRKGWKMSGLTKAHGPLNSCRIANSNLASHVENHVFVQVGSFHWWVCGLRVLLEEWHQPIFYLSHQFKVTVTVTINVESAGQFGNQSPRVLGDSSTLGPDGLIFSQHEPWKKPLVG